MTMLGLPILQEKKAGQMSNWGGGAENVAVVLNKNS